MTIFVLGNGVSRRDIKIETLQAVAPVYGCNALYRTHTPSVLVATDQPIAEAIQSSGYSQQHCFYTRRPRPDSGANAVPPKYFGFSSGPIAVSLAAATNRSPVYLLGFDMGPHLGQFNNVYADTEFYKPHHATPTFTGNWARQLVSVMHDYADIEFVRVQGDTTATIAEFETVSNLRHMPIADFEHMINNMRGI